MTLEQLNKLDIEGLKIYFKNNKHEMYTDLDGEGGTILFYSVWYGSIDLLNFLLKELKINIYQKDKMGDSVLFSVTLNGNNTLEILSILIKEGLSINDLDSDGNTILQHFVNHIAIECPDKKNLNILQAIIDFGVNVDNINYDGKTALDLAKESVCIRCDNDKRVVKLLSHYYELNPEIRGQGVRRRRNS